MPVIDDFERDTLGDAYTGDTAAFTVSTIRATSGTRSLHAIGSGHERIQAIEPDGLHAPEPGEVIEFDIYPIADQRFRLNLAYDGPTDRLLLTVDTDSASPEFSLKLATNGVWSTILRDNVALPTDEWLTVRLRWDAGNKIFKGSVKNSTGDVLAVDAGETNNRVPLPEIPAFSFETVRGERWIDNFRYTDLATPLGTSQVDHVIGPNVPTVDPSMHSHPGWGLHFSTDKQFDLGAANIYANRIGKTFAELHAFENGELQGLVDSTEIAVSSGGTDLVVDLSISAGPGEYLLTRDYDSPIDMSTEGVELAKVNQYGGYATDSTDYLTLHGSRHPIHGDTKNWYNFHDVTFTVYEDTGDTALDQPDAGDNYDADGNPIPNDFEPFGVHTGDVPDVGWVRTFHDWFDGGSLNTDKWSIGYPWGRTMAPKLEYCRDSDVWVDAGTDRLVLRLDRDDEYNMLTSTEKQRTENGWYSGVVNTHETFDQQYGYWEASIKLPTPLKGVLPSYWLRASNGSWPPELDVVQQFQDAKQTRHSIHYLDDDGAQTTADVYESYIDAASKKFRVYGMEWSPDGMWWYRDGKIIDRQTVAGGTGPGQLDRPQEFYAMLSAHLWNDPAVGDPRVHTGWPYTWEVDWIQVWEHPEADTVAESFSAHADPLPGANVTLHRRE